MKTCFIVRLGYTYTYNSSGATTLKTSQRNSYSIRFNIEESGNLLYLFSRMINGSPKNGGGISDGQYQFCAVCKDGFRLCQEFHD